MNSRRFLQAGGAALAAFGLLASISCSDRTREGKAASYIVLERLQAVSGTATEFEDTLESDVLTKNSIYEDKGRIVAHVAMKDLSLGTKPSLNNSITLERYHVNYVRSDGRNTQGVDVPWSFDGAVTGTLSEESTTVGFVLVRVQAKDEAPLRALRFNGGAQVISTIAEVTFYGRDQAGNAVSVTGTISVNFADWADPTS